MKESRHSKGHVAILLGTVLVLVVGLCGYYCVRTTSNWDSLRERNLRELARMSRAIENKINNFQGILKNLAENEADLQKKAGLVPVVSVELEEVPSVSDEPALHADPGRRPSDKATVQLDLPGRQLSLRYEFQRKESGKADRLALKATSPLESLLPFLESNLFDEVFLATAAREVFLHAAQSGIRLQQIPLLEGPDRV